MCQPAQLLDPAEKVTRLAGQAQAQLPETGDDPGIKPQAQDIDENSLSGFPSNPLRRTSPRLTLRVASPRAVITWSRRLRPRSKLRT